MLRGPEPCSTLRERERRRLRGGGEPREDRASVSCCPLKRTASAPALERRGHDVTQKHDGGEARRAHGKGGSGPSPGGTIRTGGEDEAIVLLCHVSARRRADGQSGAGFNPVTGH